MENKKQLTVEQLLTVKGTHSTKLDYTISSNIDGLDEIKKEIAVLRSVIKRHFPEDFI